jgi:hypothetical protein
MRKVEVSQWVRHPEKSYSEKEIKGVATFHSFGVAHEEFENGPGNYTTAVVEWPDGSVENVEVSLVRFLSENPLIHTHEDRPMPPCKSCGKPFARTDITAREYLGLPHIYDVYNLNCACGYAVYATTRRAALTLWEIGPARKIDA